MPKGWFAIEGQQEGDRTLEEQMLGLDGALEVARGGTVLDLGCAEGLIAARFAEVAKEVHGLDNNLAFVSMAQSIAPRVRVGFADLNSDWPDWLEERYDVVLALAILHKLHEPAEGVRHCAQRARELIVVRLPAGSRGEVRSKHFRTVCDLRMAMPKHGFAIELETPGPRGELVQYWRRGGSLRDAS